MKRLVGKALSFLFTVLQAVPLYILLLTLGLVSLLWNLTALPLYLVLPEAVGVELGRAVIARAYRLFWTCACTLGMMRIDASCLDSLREERGLIIVANHPTMLDALLLVARLPRSACIMKAELIRNVFLGTGARLARYIRNDSARTMIRLAVKDLRRGGQLVIFPEGTRTVDPPLNAFRPGVTLIAKLARAPIQTVFIDTDTPYLRKGWPIWRVPPLPIVVKLRLGQRFTPGAGADAHVLLADLEQYYRRHLKEERAAQGASATCTSPRAPTLS
jgi:1-acyl-sn-glycerol-3-phosphate acyltransferase